MVVGSRPSLRRPMLRGDHKSESPSISPVIEPHQLRGESLKRLRVPSITEHDRYQKRRRIANNNQSSQLQIPLRGRTLPKLVSPKIVTQAVLSPLQSQIIPVPESPKTQYDQIRSIEEKARIAIRGGSGGHVPGVGDDKRSLRSQDGGSRSKSELAQYFNHYEQMLSLEPTEPDPLTANTRITIIDDTPGFQPSPPNSPKSKARRSDPFGASKPLHNATRIDLSQHAVPTRRNAPDPLDPEMFVRVHKKEERRAKQIRNSERERSLHEKVQLERLLGELKGADWLRTMGISGITETEKKKYEPKRALLVREIKAMITKFVQWKEMEKDQEKKQREALTGDDTEAGDVDTEGEEETGEDEETEQSSRAPSPTPPITLPDSNDVDAMAARQLIQEAKSAHKRRKAVSLVPVLAAETYKPFTSFYEKKHVRDAAIGRHGRRSRGETAFGVAVPDWEVEEFQLPDSFLTDDALRAAGRRRRIRHRESLG